MGHRISDIAAALGATAEGALDLIVTGAAEPAAAGPFDLALALSPAAGACKCERTYAKRRVRSAAEAKGWWVVRRPHVGKQPPRVHQATQNSLPASFGGGRWSRMI